jgi:hypothetical protein
MWKCASAYSGSMNRGEPSAYALLKRNITDRVLIDGRSQVDNSTSVLSLLFVLGAYFAPSDIITQLMSAANMNGSKVEAPYIPNPLKRALDPEPEPESAPGPYHNPDPTPGSSSDNSSPESLHTPEDVSQQFSSSTFNTDELFSLPMYTEDLGRLPVYEPLNWVNTYAGVLPESGFPDSNGMV